MSKVTPERNEWQISFSARWKNIKVFCKLIFFCFWWLWPGMPELTRQVCNILAISQERSLVYLDFWCTYRPLSIGNNLLHVSIKDCTNDWFYFKNGGRDQSPAIFLFQLLRYIQTSILNYFCHVNIRNKPINKTANEIKLTEMILSELVLVSYPRLVSLFHTNSPSLYIYFVGFVCYRFTEANRAVEWDRCTENVSTNNSCCGMSPSKANSSSRLESTISVAVTFLNFLFTRMLC